MKRWTLSLAVLCGAIFSGIQASVSNDFDWCILAHMETGTGDEAAKAIRSACRSLYSKWSDHKIKLYTSRTTRNNDNLRENCQGPYRDPEKKYCADVTEIFAQVHDNEDYEYRFKPYSGTCPEISVHSGPEDKMEVLSCNLSDDGKRFTAKVKGWTEPQSFSAELTIQIRRH